MSDQCQPVADTVASLQQKNECLQEIITNREERLQCMEAALCQALQALQDQTDVFRHTTVKHIERVLTMGASHDQKPY